MNHSLAAFWMRAFPLDFHSETKCSSNKRLHATKSFTHMKPSSHHNLWFLIFIINPQRVCVCVCAWAYRRDRYDLKGWFERLYLIMFLSLMHILNKFAHILSHSFTLIVHCNTKIKTIKIANQKFNLFYASKKHCVHAWQWHIIYSQQVFYVQHHVEWELTW